jgi:hypothetical protein
VDHLLPFGVVVTGGRMVITLAQANTMIEQADFAYETKIVRS